MMNILSSKQNRYFFKIFLKSSKRCKRWYYKKITIFFLRIFLFLINISIYFFVLERSLFIFQLVPIHFILLSFQTLNIEHKASCSNRDCSSSSNFISVIDAPFISKEVTYSPTNEE